MRLRGRHTHSLSTNRVVTNLCGNRCSNRLHSLRSSLITSSSRPFDKLRVWQVMLLRDQFSSRLR